MNKGQMNTLKGPSASEQVAALEQRVADLEADYPALQQERDALAQQVEALRQERDTAWERARKSWEEEHGHIDAAWRAAADQAKQYIELHAAERALRKQAESTLTTAQQDAARLREALEKVEDYIATEVADATAHLQNYELGSNATGAHQTRGELRMLTRVQKKLRAALTAPAHPTGGQ